MRNCTMRKKMNKLVKNPLFKIKTISNPSPVVALALIGVLYASPLRASFDFQSDDFDASTFGNHCASQSFNSTSIVRNFLDDDEISPFVGDIFCDSWEQDDSFLSASTNRTQDSLELDPISPSVNGVGEMNTNVPKTESPTTDIETVLVVRDFSTRSKMGFFDYIHQEPAALQTGVVSKEDSENWLYSNDSKSTQINGFGFTVFGGRIVQLRKHVEIKPNEAPVVSQRRDAY